MPFLEEPRLEMYQVSRRELHSAGIQGSTLTGREWVAASGADNPLRARIRMHQGACGDVIGNMPFKGTRRRSGKAEKRSDKVK